MSLGDSLARFVVGWHILSRRPRRAHQRASTRAPATLTCREHLGGQMAKSQTIALVGIACLVVMLAGPASAQRRLTVDELLKPHDFKSRPDVTPLPRPEEKQLMKPSDEKTAVPPDQEPVQEPHESKTNVLPAAPSLEPVRRLDDPSAPPSEPLNRLDDPSKGSKSEIAGQPRRTGEHRKRAERRMVPPRLPHEEQTRLT